MCRIPRCSAGPPESATLGTRHSRKVAHCTLLLTGASDVLSTSHHRHHYDCQNTNINYYTYTTTNSTANDNNKQRIDFRRVCGQVS
ncbi:hypothetical protein E2C01_056628 [Portunus trituberculatus]|uniref:Uncharacterized protein n=1 Tax=Portunus trituberculatus TaxID=210409 RepID=A0A5B7GUN1_PORTR|nr:hypothetical protein [Portunus trituberculatus]